MLNLSHLDHLDLMYAHTLIQLDMRKTCTKSWISMPLLTFIYFVQLKIEMTKISQCWPSIVVGRWTMSLSHLKYAMSPLSLSLWLHCKVDLSFFIGQLQDSPH